MHRRLVLCLATASILAATSSALPADPARIAADEQVLRDAHLAADGPALLQFFRKRATQGVDQGRLDRLIRELGDDDFEVREQASQALVELGPQAVRLLRQASNDPDPEIAHRARECLLGMQKGVSAQVTAAAARLIAMKKPAGAAEVLLAFLPFAEDETVAVEVRAALVAVAVRDGTPEPALVAGLADKSPVKRAGAAEALLRAGVADQRAAIRRLLQDSDWLVRMRVGLALARTRDRDAVPVLIDLLGQLPVSESWPLEDLLYRLADDGVPLRNGTDEAARRRFRDDWAKWWEQHGGTVDMARAEPPKVLGYTMVMLLDQGRLLELDAQNRVRWSIEGLRSPLDAQFLLGDKVLIAEQAAGRVVERNLKGEILWEQKVDEPLAAQRLPNGHTFIVARRQLLEVDAAGKQVLTHSLPVGELVMRAQKCRDGRIVCVTSDNSGISRCVHLDSACKELHSFPVNVATFGGRIDALPNGHVIVPEKDRNRVVEYDVHGGVVWQLAVEQPIVVTRLPGGNLLVTSMNQLRAVELDTSGPTPKEVWEYRAETRVTRAWRR